MRIADEIHARMIFAGMKSAWTYEAALHDLCGDLVKQDGGPPAQMRRLASAMARAPELFEVRYGKVQSHGGREARTRNFRVILEDAK